MIVLVTGSTGLVGKAFQRIVKNHGYIDNNYYFVSSKDANLCNPEECDSLYRNIKPDIVVHLAAKVGGLFYNMEHNRDMYVDNMKMNMNIMEASERHKVKKTIVCLSTCIFPDKTSEMHLSDLHQGPPHESNYGYAFAKRNLEVMCRLYNSSSSTGAEFHYVIPCNIYGPEDHFNLVQSHVIPALITRFEQAIETNTDVVRLFGTGRARRQFVYVDDVVRSILNIVEGTTIQRGHVIAPPIEHSIAETAKIIAREVGYNGKIVFDGDASKDGQLRKFIVSKEAPHTTWVSLEEGIQETLRKRI